MMSSMKITMTFLVRNEEDIIRQNILFHHAQGVDSFIVMDNLSTDGTADAIRDLSRYIHIEYIYQAQDDYSQSEWVTEMARRACTDHGADWVINNDADEFWRAKSGTIKEFIASVADDVGILRLRRHNAVLYSSGGDPLLATSHPQHSEYFEGLSINNAGLPLPRKCIHRASPSALVAQGNHGVEGVPGRIVDVDSTAYILHYPFRSCDTYKQKIRLGGAAYNRNVKLSPDVGITWREHYRLLETPSLEEFWRGLCRQRRDVLIDAAEGKVFRDTSVVEFLREQPTRSGTGPLCDSLKKLEKSTRTAVDAFVSSQVDLLMQIPESERRHRPLYHNLEFCISGPERHLDRVAELKSSGSPADLSKRFSELRDVFSLFPRNNSFLEFLGQLLAAGNPEATRRLRADCDAKPVVLHVSCIPRVHLAERSIESFNGVPDSYHHIIILGQSGAKAEDDVELGFTYDGRTLTVPVPDDYESLHRKVFYTLTLLNLAANPACVVKVDDNLALQDAVRLDALLSSLISGNVEYAGRLIGSQSHETQWHGWHVGKCSNLDVEERGYQYPLPRQYAAGGYGYVLGKQGIAACAYMYLAMKEFFSMRSVGLEDAYVGHAMYARGIELHNVASDENLLSLPGLTGRETALL